MEGGSSATTPPPEQSRAAELSLYRDLCVAAAQSGEFGNLPQRLAARGFKPGSNVALGGSLGNSVTGWTRAGSDIAVFTGASERKQDFCAVVFPGQNAATGVNAPLAEARLWYVTTLSAVGREPSALISSAPIRVTGANGASSTLSYELAAGGFAVYAANYN
jgi:hypothetical protein